ncbi:MAG: pilus assembly protein TadG-related protein [Pirellulales bacterium]
MSRQTLSVAGQAMRGQRRGVIVVLTAFLLTVLFAFLALSVDTGRVVLTETQMQNAADAASLAASQEIQAAVHAAGQGVGSATIDANSIAVESARQMAADVAEANGVHIDPTEDVEFGKRIYNPSGGDWHVQWGGAPYNVVKVTARRTGPDTSAPNGEFPLAFGWAIGKDSVPIEVSSTAFTEARDLVLVLDWSASMNDDSSFNSSLGTSTVEGLLDGMWDALRQADPKWPGTSTSKFPSTGFGQVNSYYGTYVSSTTNSTIMSTLGLNQNNADGSRKYPFPQAGRNSNDLPKSKPSNSTSDSLWDGYITWVKNHSNSTYKKRYGYRTLMDYLQQNREDRTESEDLWRTPHYPFAANVKGASMFLNFLEDLDFGDEVGLVGYGQWAVQEKSINDGEVSMDISADPITANYSDINELQRRHQAGEYNGWTAMGDGILKARELLVGVANDPNDEGFSRYGARPTMIVMTDGQTNQKPSNWSLPTSFKWKDWTDYDGNGAADYSTSDNNKRYAFWEATEAVKRGITIHTIAVGAQADRDLMRAIAFAGGGVFIDVPVHSTVEEVEEQLSSAFSQIAAKVPAAQLMYEDD